MRDALLPLWQRRQLAFVPFAGTDDLSRSHFETQDDIESGQAGRQRRDYRSGFMARLSGVLSGVPAIAFTDSLPLTFQGGGDLPNVSLRGIGKGGLDARQAQILSQMYDATPLAAAAREGLALRQQVTAQLREEMEQAGRGAASARTFADETRRMASLMRERYRLGFVDVGGWDTHANQGSVEGGLANNLRNLGEGLAAYADALGPAWKDTVVVVLSEFGRTFRENGSKGTDHGHGTTYWVLGGSVRGGRIAGEQVAVTHGAAAAEPRLSGAHQLPQPVWRCIEPVVGIVACAAGTGVSRSQAARSWVGVSAWQCAGDVDPSRVRPRAASRIGVLSRLERVRLMRATALHETTA